VPGGGDVIRLFVSDLDGCVSVPFQQPPLDVLGELVALHRSRAEDPCVPSLTLCTGRPLAYADAVAQWLGVEVPFLFESGSGMYDPVANRVWWSPHLNRATEEALDQLRPLIHGDLAARYPGTMAEFAKLEDVGVVNPDAAVIAKILGEVEGLVAELVAGSVDGDVDLEIHSTPVSVNVIPRAANKGSGIAWLAGHLGLSLDEIAFMGDSGGDLSGLTRVAMAFAPANAADEVKAVARVMAGEATRGLLEAYRAVIEHNRGLAREGA